jgi:hypothetical protein
MLLLDRTFHLRNFGFETRAQVSVTYLTHEWVAERIRGGHHAPSRFVVWKTGKCVGRHSRVRASNVMANATGSSPLPVMTRPKRSPALGGFVSKTGRMKASTGNRPSAALCRRWELGSHKNSLLPALPGLKRMFEFQSSV